MSVKQPPIMIGDRFGGLDGLRAIAVTLVIIFHLTPALLPGGFLGVDMFFVISGFLITSLLLREHRIHGRISLGSFWRRRARRLLPALIVVLLCCTSLALLFSDSLIAELGAQLAGALFFVANWVYIALGADYFATEHTELFRNMWSLGVEEQFYIVLPLLLLFALRMRSPATRTLFFGLFGVICALWMAVLFLEGASASRVYFGTDTHVFGLLLGAALACALPSQQRVKPLRGWQQGGLLLIAAAAFITLGVLAATLREGSPESFTGGMQLGTLAALLAVWAVTRRGSWAGLLLDLPPLRWVGERSYGMYLWHWPLLVIIGEAVVLIAGVKIEWLIAGTTLACTVLFAALSYRFIEQPIRRVGLRRALSELLRPLRLHGRKQTAAWVALAGSFVLISVTSVALTIAPARIADPSIIARGEVVRDAQAYPLPNTAGMYRKARTTEKAGEESPSLATVAPVSLRLDWSPQAEIAPPPEPIHSHEIMAIGDSVMLASAPELAAAFPDIWIDAEVSRGLWAGVSIAEELVAQGSLRPVLVVGLGTNGPVDEEALIALRRVAAERRIVLVNAYGDRWWIPEVNAQLAAFAAQHRGVTLADWHTAIAAVPGGLAPDDIHPNPSGGVAYADSVQRALDELLETHERAKR